MKVYPIMLMGTAVLVSAVDLGSKAWANHALEGKVIEVLPALTLTLNYNTGVSFGLLAGRHPWLTIAITTAVLGFIAIAGFKLTSTNERVALSLIMGGRLGNLIDRLSDNAVTDFILLHGWGWRFPTFNLADVAITLGAVVLIASLIATFRPQQVG